LRTLHQHPRRLRLPSREGTTHVLPPRGSGWRFGELTASLDHHVGLVRVQSAPGQARCRTAP
jgi:hypothetical protein